MDEILTSLNEKQREAVVITDGPILIIAGAGSGKTKTLTHRVAYLVTEKGIYPKNILAVTFTNKAAGEMKERIKKLLSGNGKEEIAEYNMPNVGTFHAICAKILRHEIKALEYKSSFNIFDPQDQLAIIKKVLKKLEINPDQFKPRSLLSAISKAKNELIDAEKFSAGVSGYFEEITAKVYAQYQEELKNSNALDFDDLIRLVIKIFQKFPEILAKYQKLFKYIMVDEYQDTNHAQYVLVNLLAKEHRNLCVVGDDWQCFPKGTKINTESKKIKIEKIIAKDIVQAASGHGKICDQIVAENKRSNFNGQLIRILTRRGKELTVTPNHIIFAKLSLKVDIFYVYLMYRKTTGYRIGVAKGARISKSNEWSVGLNVRANQERADKMWILKVCKLKGEATYFEQYFSAFYGIPELVFFTNGRKMKLEQKYIDRLYEEIDTTERAKKIFKDLKLNFDYPHHIPEATIRNDIKRITINLTLFGDPRRSLIKNWGRHRLSINSNDKVTEKILNNNGFKTRKGKLSDWRFETQKTDYSEIETILNKIKKLLPEAIIAKKAILTKNKKFYFTPASHVRETMTVPIYDKGKIVEDEVVKIESIDYKGEVFDLNIDNVHNYIANDFVVHNSIYGWRQADIRNILSFEKDYPETKVVTLEQNYRSTQTILDAAHGIISKNVHRKDKKLWTEKAGGHLIVSYEAEDEKDEAGFVAKEIKNLMSEKKEYNYNSFVVLYRTNAQSRVLEEIFLQHSIPYRIIGGIKFYLRKEIKDMMAYLRLIENPSEYISLERIIGETGKGIGEATLNKWVNMAKENNMDPISLGLKSQILNPKSETNSPPKADQPSAGKYKIQNSKSDEIAKFCEFITRMQEAKTRISLTDLIEKVFRESGYEKILQDGTAEGEARWENVKELISVAQKYDNKTKEESSSSLSLFLEEVALASDTDDIDRDKAAVHLMTLHSVKGLEFPVVFIVGLEEGIMPHSRSMLSQAEMEEERRLMYVGVTRAKEKVYLLFTNQRIIFGSSQANPPSRFLDDIPAHLMEQTQKESISSKLFLPSNKSRPKRDELTYKSQNNFEPKTAKKINAGNFKDGEKVNHPHFGEGRIVSIQGDIATVAFQKSGLKKLSLSIAPLEKI
jgi:DNA helicase-2/ATP-dependent DNA helicase PcrA